MTVADRPIKLVLDTSAILAFTRGSIDVGEPISEVADEGGVSALPTLCLAVAKWMVDDLDRLRLLTEHPDTVVVSASQDPFALGNVETSVGNLDASAAVLTRDRPEGIHHDGPTGPVSRPDRRQSHHRNLNRLTTRSAAGDCRWRTACHDDWRDRAGLPVGATGGATIPAQAVVVDRGDRGLGPDPRAGRDLVGRARPAKRSGAAHHRRGAARAPAGHRRRARGGSRAGTGRRAG